MKITFDESRKVFQIANDRMAYAFAVSGTGRLVNLHWGAAVGSTADYDFLLNNRSLMYPGGHGYTRAEFRSGDAFDFGEPCLRATLGDGSEALRLHYVSHEIGDDRLSVTMEDTGYPLQVTLKYRTWGDLPLISRSAVITNTGDKPIVLHSAKSATWQLPLGRDFRLTHYSGEWGAEYHKNQIPVQNSRVELASNRLTDAAMHELAFFALDEDGRSTEKNGEVYFGFLEWSGDFQITVEMQHTQNFRCMSVTGGVSALTAEIPLAAGESFTTPEFVGGFVDGGFSEMSNVLFDWQFEHIHPRGKNTDKANSPFPIIYNTWYPYEFKIDEQKLIDFIPKAKYIGAELYVIDDGWMPKRVNDKAGLGDWVADPVRFPRGMGYIADEAHKAGLMFGIWVEPEMVNPDSDLYRAHPDWILSEPNRDRTLQRTQCILDMSRDEIVDWAIDWLDRLVIDAKLDYLKWDMNREISEIGLYGLERGVAVKYMRGIERIWQHLNDRFPDLLLENCASGGGRADFGMVRYADRVNRSDNADPIDVMFLHEGYSSLYVPKMAGGAGNVSPCPNGINGRYVPLNFRVNSGMTGSMSIGVNILQSSQEELDALRDAVTYFKTIRPALQDSYVYRISSVYEHPYQVLEYCKRDGTQFTAFAFGHGMHQWDKQMPLFRMRGLKADGIYVSEKGERRSGASLMSIGIMMNLRGDYASTTSTWRLEK